MPVQMYLKKKNGWHRYKFDSVEEAQEAIQKYSSKPLEWRTLPGAPNVLIAEFMPGESAFIQCQIMPISDWP